MKVHPALADLKKALDDSPKSKAGFVNFNRSRNLQKAAVAKMVETGETEQSARAQAFEVARPYDTTYSKSKPA